MDVYSWWLAPHAGTRRKPRQRSPRPSLSGRRTATTAWRDKEWRRGVSIGDTLAEARRQADLTVTQVSQRTCIRETIIRGIERGDYSACGGDFYARGHIRSIARAVGADPEALIREYDETQGEPRAISAADVFEPATPIKIRERRGPNGSRAMLLALAVVVGLVVYHLVSSSPPSRPPRPRPARGTWAPRCTSPRPSPRRTPGRRHDPAARADQRGGDPDHGHRRPAGSSSPRLAEPRSTRATSTPAAR